ncbi:hypothetical protein [Campylobacter volucris]|uniref:hypothetical protein n=1 Tax=Campylobacter volucris TaxID=1031542 RepID=UPI0010592D47|nr:hypothetical protein [Campylobacter volucris]TDJ82089.1 hypothetical protein E2O25_02135 [Campylobacter volucris]
MIWKDSDLNLLNPYELNFKHNAYIYDFYKIICPEYVTISEHIKDNLYEIYTSIDGINWAILDINDFFIKNNFMLYHINESRKVRFIKIVVKKNQVVLLEDVAILIRKYNFLIISSRTDGMAGILYELIYSMFLANKLGVKFGYNWSTIEHYDTDYQTEDLLFSDNFINNYSYKIQVSYPDNYKGDIFELKNKPYDFYFGYVNLLATNRIFFDFKKYKKELSDEFFKIDFSCEIKNLFMSIDKKVKQFREDFVAIHIRNGDIIYEDKHKNLQKYHYYKVMPLEIVLEIIKLESHKQIILFSDTPINAFKIKKYCKNNLFLNNIFYIGELFPEIYNMNDSHACLFDIYFMSKAKKLYSAESGLAHLANLISVNNQVFCNLYNSDFFNTKDIFNIIISNVGKIDSDNTYKSFIYFLLFSISENRDYVYLLNLINKSYFYDKTNYSHLLYKITLLIQLNRIEYAEYELSIVFNENHNDFLNYVLYIWGSMSINKNHFDIIVNNAGDNYPYISYFACLILLYEREYDRLNSLYNSLNCENIFLLNIKYFVDCKSAVEIITNSAQYLTGKLIAKLYNENRIFSFPFIFYKNLKTIKNKYIYKYEQKLFFKSYDDYLNFKNILKDIKFILGNEFISCNRYGIIGYLFFIIKIFIFYIRLCYDKRD